MLIYFSIFARSKFSQKKHYRFAIPIDQEFQIKFKGTRSFDFLLDHKDINSRDTVFILKHRVSENFLSKYKQKGYQFFRRKSRLFMSHIHR